MRWGRGSRDAGLGEGTTEVRRASTAAGRVNRTLLRVQIRCHIPGLLHVELGMFGIDAARHVALNELGGDRDMVHAGGRVETVRAPERRKPIASVVGGRAGPR